MPEKESIVVLARVKFGSTREERKIAGIAHLIEHCVLGRTKKRTNFQISRQVDSIGAYLNAHTGKESTSYEFKGLKKYLNFGLEILSDCIFNCSLDKKTIEGERKIIYNEINRILDEPEDYLVTEFEKNLFKNHPKGREIIGTKKSLDRISQNDVKRVWKQNYSPNNMEITISGKLEEKATKKLLEKYFGKQKSQKIEKKEEKLSNFTKNSISLKKPIKQTLYCIGFPTITTTAPTGPSKKDIYCQILLNSLLVDGLSSRLYQEIREKRKLAYFVRSNLGRSNFDSYAILVGLEQKNLPKVKAILKKEFKNLALKEIPRKELQLNKNKTIVELTLLKEENLDYVRVVSTLSEKEIKTIDELIDGVRKVSGKELKEFSKKHFKEEKSTEVEILPG